mgnify:CR=1 FL=1
MRKFSARSKRNMKGLHPDLIAVLTAALHRTPLDFVVTEGLRTEARQRELVASGASKTMNSRHLTGHAFDIALIMDQGGITWQFEAYRNAASVFKDVAQELGIDLEWGGDWRSFKDGPHFQLSWAKYPKDEWVTHSKAPEPRVIAESRTMQGVAAAGIGQTMQQGAEQISSVAADLPDDSSLLTAIKVVGLALTLGGLALAAYARWDDWKAGHR